MLLGTLFDQIEFDHIPVNFKDILFLLIRNPVAMVILAQSYQMSRKNCNFLIPAQLQSLLHSVQL